MSHPQVNRWLAGERTPDLKTHVEACEECATQIAKMEAPLAAFRDALHRYSEREIRPAVVLQPSRAGMGWLRIAVAAAAMIVIAVVGIHRHNQEAAAIERADDALLEQVATDVSRSVPATLEPLDKLMSNSYTEGTAQ